MMRWWWFGPAVEKTELTRELHTMQAGGIGGVEIQPVYALELDDPAKNFRNLPYLSKDFLDMVSFTAQTAHDLGMRLNLTLSSGWPYGGSYVPVTDAAGRLRIVVVAVPADATSLPIPSIGNGERLLATFLTSGTPSQYDSEHTQQLEAIGAYRLTLPGGLSGPHVVLFFISSRTGQQVKRAAVGAEGFVLDHFSMEAIQNHLKTVADPLIQACGKNIPYSVFSDSLEVYESDWTPDFLDEFRTRRGYDLTPHLPVLNCELAAATPQINRIREWVLGDYSIQAGSDKSLKVDIDASIGVAQWLPGKNVKQVIEQADAAMYLDKKQSRKRRLCEPQPGVPHGQHGVCASHEVGFPSVHL